MNRSLITLFVVALMAPPQVAECQSFTATLATLSSDDAAIRTNSLARLGDAASKAHVPICSPTASTDIRGALIRALESENVRVQHGHWPEAESEFYANLIGCVSSLRDRRSVQALVDAIDTGGGATNGIIALGDASIPAVVAKLRARGARTTERVFAAGTLGAFVVPGAPQIISAANKALIRQSLLTALADKSMLVRSAAIPGLVTFRDPEVRHAVAMAAAADTGMKIGAEARRFTVRKAAREWMKVDSITIKK
jgi:hypothetical protein